MTTVRNGSPVNGAGTQSVQNRQTHKAQTAGLLGRVSKAVSSFLHPGVGGGWGVRAAHQEAARRVGVSLAAV